MNDSVVRVRLVSSGLVCSLCSTPNVSPDSVGPLGVDILAYLLFVLTICLVYSW